MQTRDLCIFTLPVYLHVDGVLFRSIGVSNYGVPELAILLASAKITPAANQVCIGVFFLIPMYSSFEKYLD